MRVAEGEDDLLAFQLRAVADADDVELALEPGGDADHAVGDEAAGQAVKLPELRVSGRRLRDETPVGELEVDAGRIRLPQVAFGALQLHGAVQHLDRDTFRDRDRLLTNSGHISQLSAVGSQLLSSQHCQLKAE